MIRYERFQETVLQQSGSSGHSWIHVLPSVPIAYRYRFLQTLRQGFSIPDSYDMIMLSQRLEDKDYDLFLQQALAAKLTSKQDIEGFVEKFTAED